MVSFFFSISTKLLFAPNSTHSWKKHMKKHRQKFGAKNCTEPKSTLAKLLYKMHYSCCNVLKRQIPGSVLFLNLRAQTFKGRFCTYRSKILARPAWKIAQTRVRFSNCDSIVPQVTNNNQPYCPQASAPSLEFEHENVRFFYNGKMVHNKKIK